MEYLGLEEHGRQSRLLLKSEKKKELPRQVQDLAGKLLEGSLNHARHQNLHVNSMEF